ncbi:expressed unknown protein [Seminavis robusta]|uniref:Uncharacterized protein n=1 Tax=Seminavis robusta TaxID=568900 RepID=A0A9N8HTS9_9STRA|nr:expressed unknown protein [Seminavis robusta]|eukprot:Sro1640_g287900.1 n/a (696) ;mRNA; f:3274-5452
MMKPCGSSAPLCILLLLLNAAIVAANWEAHIDSVHGQSFDFTTGSEHGAELRVEAYDECRKDAGQRNWMGEFYPSTSMTGIRADTSRVHGPGGGNHISFTFTEGINENLNLYSDNGDNTATVEFCAQVGLYHSGVLVNFSEVKLTYNVDLVTNFASLTGYTVTGAEAYTDAEDVEKNFDGSLRAYFCNPSSFEELQDDGSVTNQGSILNLCFTVASGGEFKIKDVQDLLVRNGMGEEPSQVIISGSQAATPIYAEKICHEGHSSETNVCVVSFMLQADFYDYERLTLTGEGQILLELGGFAGSSRRLLRHRLLTERVGHVSVQAMEMRFNALTKEEQLEEENAAVSVPIAAGAVAAMVALCSVLWARMFCTRRPPSRKDQVYQKLRMKKGKDMDGDATVATVTKETIDLTMSISTIVSDISDTPSSPGHRSSTSSTSASSHRTSTSTSSSSRTSSGSRTNSISKTSSSNPGRMGPTKLERASSTSKTSSSNSGRLSPPRLERASSTSKASSSTSELVPPTRLERAASTSKASSGSGRRSPTRRLERTPSASSHTTKSSRKSPTKLERTLERGSSRSSQKKISSGSSRPTPDRLERTSSGSSHRTHSSRTSPTKLERGSSTSSHMTSSCSSPRSTKLLLAEEDVGDEIIDVTARNSGRLSSGDILEMTASMQSALSTPGAGRRRGSGTSHASGSSC